VSGLKLAGLVCSGTVVGLLMVEFLMQVVVPHEFTYRHPAFIVESEGVHDSPEQMADPLYGAGLRFTDEPWQYELKPNMKARLVSSEFDTGFETDSAGRRVGPSATVAPHPMRVLGLGDSFAMGFGVEHGETYLARFGAAVSQTTGRSVDVINGGVVGYAPGNSYRLLEKRIDELRPDIVLFQLWVGDDLCLGAEASRPLSQSEADASRVWRNLIRGSHVAMAIRDRLKANDATRLWLMQRGYVQPFVTIDWLDRRFRDRCGGLDELAKLLRDTRQLTEERDSRLIVVLIPLLEQVDAEAFRRALVYNGVSEVPESVDFDAPNRVMRDLAAEAGVDLLDVTEVLRALPNPGAGFFQRDPHLTAVGHGAVAEALAQHLAQETTAAPSITE